MQILLFVTLITIMQAAPPPSTGQHLKETGDAQQTEKRESKKSSPTSNTVVGQDVIHAQPSQEKREGQKNDPADNPHRKLDWLNGISTLIIAIFAVITAVAVIFQVVTARRIERAWITVTIRHDTEEDKFISKILDIDTANLECVLLNCGRTPARLTSFAVRNCVSKSLEATDEPDYGKCVELDSMILAPNDTVPMPHRIQESTLRLFDGDNGDLYIYGVIHYLDAFKKSHFTRFCLCSPHMEGRILNPELFFRRGGPSIYSKAS